jgi:hypothetical protein
MLGKAAIAMWWDVAPEVQAEWEDWHSNEHMPERLAIPGFLRGTRWIAVSGPPSYFVLYEAADLATITSGAYLERLNNPTPWSRKMMPHHRNMVRSLCLVRASGGVGLGGVLATIRLTTALPALPRRQGVHLLEAQPRAGEPQTEEERIRGGDATADRILLVNGYGREAVRKTSSELAPDAVIGLYQLAYCLTSQ